MEMSEQINELAAALSKAQASFKHVAKNKTVTIQTRERGQYSYKYGDLADSWDTARAQLTTNGLSVVQSPSFNEGWLILHTIIMHSSGQWIRGTMQTLAKADDVKSLGSAITYLRRYAFCSMTGLVADEDDDGGSSNAGAHTNGAKQYSEHPVVTNAATGKITDPQRRKLFALWKENEYEGTLQAWVETNYKRPVDELTSKEASAAIETLHPQAVKQ
jgi:hypothetical protein